MQASCNRALGPAQCPGSARVGARVHAGRSRRLAVLASTAPVPTPELIGTSDDVLKCPDIRDKLSKRVSPFKVHNNFGGGFVSDGDRVALTSMRFASCESAGAMHDSSMPATGTAVVGEDAAAVPAASCQADIGAAQYMNPEGRIDGQQANGSNGSSKQNWMEASMEQLLAPLPPWAIRAGARETVFHDPKHTNCAIVTCGGLCPGLNDVIAGLVFKLTDYGVPEGNILGIRYGFRGFYDKAHKPVVLTKKSVDGIQFQGGTILGTSRGGANIKEIVKRIDMWGIDMLFVVGGNGGNAGANAIQQKCAECGVVCNVIGVPKSIDNDILLIDKCFGFDTAVEEAQRALMAAKVEASSAKNGIGLVKLMGRQSGFIAVQASMASGVVDACLIPEVPFLMKGDNGLFAYLEKVLEAKGHAVVCVAEGAGQDLLQDEAVSNGATDASGNPILKDIGVYLRSEMKAHFKDGDIKYIDPSYIIRSIPTTSNDRIYCKILAHNAVHAAFAGYTGITVGLVNTHYCYLPIPVVIQAPRRIDPRGKMWNRLRASIGQPTFV